MKFIVTVNGKEMKCSDGRVYEFDSIKEAVKQVDICYGISELKRDIEIKPKEA